MSEVSEINSTFYAMRLLAHRIDLSQIGVSNGDEYPATEFTPEEQVRALEIIRGIHTDTQAYNPQLLQEITEPSVASLADRIDELATRELAAAGYDVRTPHQDLFKVTEASITSPSDAELVRKEVVTDLTSRQRRILRLIAEGRSTADIARLLQVSIRTVRVARVELKMKLKNLTETSQPGIDL